MEKMKAGFTGFNPRNGVDYYETLKTYAEIGYKGFEGGNVLFNGDFDENLKKIQAIGIRPLCVGIGNLKTANAAEIAEKAHKIGVNRAATYHSCLAAWRFHDIPECPDYDAYMKEVEMMEALAKELAKEDVMFTFHNHDTEFFTYFGDKNAFFHMVDNTEYLKFELDVGWVQYAQNDPVKVMNKLGKRLGALHVKDYAIGNSYDRNPDGTPITKPGAPTSEGRPLFTTPGTGVLKLADCLETACELGIDYAIVEQDFMRNLSMKDTLTAAYLNMKECGFVE